MSTSEQQQSRPSYPYSPGATLDFARLPIPGNAEFVVYVLILIVLAIVARIYKHVGANDWMFDATIITAAYLLSRGIAKASRVLEQ